MKLGLLSDSHGRAEITARAARMLLDHGADTLIYLGDIGDEKTLDALALEPGGNGQLHPSVHLVFGNCDWPLQVLADYARNLGITVDHPAGRLHLAGKQIAFTHGHIEAELRQALADGVDYLFHGHTHEIRDERVGDTRVINPGALFRAREHTVALLDLPQDRLDLLSLDSPDQ